mgnify:CR=1 FL=1
MSKLGVIKELDIEPAKYDWSLVLDCIDNTKFSKVKTKYSKGDDWTAISLRSIEKDTIDIRKS